MVEEMCASDKVDDVTVFFYNPNIHPRKEYEIRKEENKKFCEKLGIEFIDVDYMWRTGMREWRVWSMILNEGTDARNALIWEWNAPLCITQTRLWCQPLQQRMQRQGKFQSWSSVTTKWDDFYVHDYVM